MKTTYTQVVESKFDAGLYREFFEQRYGQVLEIGGHSNSWAKLGFHANQLAKLTGLSVDEIKQNAIEYSKNCE